MKHMFIKSVMVSAAIMMAWNCTDDTSTSNSGEQALEFTVNQNVWWLNVGEINYLIYPADATGSQVVTDSWGNVIGTYISGANNIYDVNSNILVTEVNTGSLPQIYPDRSVHYVDGTIGSLDVVTPATPASSASIQSSATNPTPVIVTSSSDNGATPATPSSSVSQDPNPVQSSATPANSSDSNQGSDKVSSSSKKEEAKSSSSKKEDGGKIGNVTYKGALEQNVANEGTIQEIVFSNVQSDPNGSRTWKLYFLDMKYDNNAKTLTVSGKVSGDQKDRSLSETINIDGNDVTITLNIGSAAKENLNDNNNDDKKSSSSKKEDAKSSSSKGGSNDPEASKYENAGKGGQQGFATRYWDCCMPSCAWPENSGGNPTKTCDAKGKNFVQGGQNICAGGQNTACTMQIPIIASDKVAYAFAATHASGGKCGKCFALTFTGSGKYESKANHQALAGKTLVVMASNIGGDVEGNQLDIMIPGGGLGQFNGCQQMGWGKQGNQYGGLLSDCENEVGYNGDLLNKRKECLSKKCNEVFKNDEQAKEGCMFLATWMEAAGNPNFESKEVECPQALKAKW